RMWAVDGTWERVFTALMAQADADEDLTWAVSADSTIVRVHQHAVGRPVPSAVAGPHPPDRTEMFAAIRQRISKLTGEVQLPPMPDGRATG
ncbi:hypothetical protein ACH4EB_38665, partial [Streptomyces sp. NPDC018045]